jgi:hypothetical protein
MGKNDPKYIHNIGSGNLDVNPDKKNKVTWGDQMLRGQNKAFAKQSAEQIAAKHLPNGKEYVHEQVTFDSVLGSFIGGKSKNKYHMKEAVQQNAAFDQLEYLEALGNGEAWAFERNDKLLQLAHDQAEKRNTKKQKQKSNYHNLIKKSEAKNKLDSIKESEAKEKLDAIHKDAETIFKNSFPTTDFRPPQEIESVEQYMARREREHKAREYSNALKKIFLLAGQNE